MSRNLRSKNGDKIISILATRVDDDRNHGQEYFLSIIMSYARSLFYVQKLDIRMPGLNGFALYQEIRRLDKKVEICFLTAGENKSYYEVYSDIFSSIPANHFIRKPIDNEGLIKRINEIIADETATLKQAT